MWSQTFPKIVIFQTELTGHIETLLRYSPSSTQQQFHPTELQRWREAAGERGSSASSLWVEALNFQYCIMYSIRVSLIKWRWPNISPKYASQEYCGVSGWTTPWLLNSRHHATIDGFSLSHYGRIELFKRKWKKSEIQCNLLH